MEEIWKDIKGFEGYYMVSNHGRVKGLGRFTTIFGSKSIFIKPKLLKSTNCHGYRNINLCKNGKKTSFLLHRLIAITFIDNPNNYPEINHKNEIKSDNHVDNLEWVTHKYNANYGTKNIRTSIALKKRGMWAGDKNPNFGNIGDKHRMFGVRGINHPSSKPVYGITDEGIIHNFESIALAADYFGVTGVAVSNAIIGKSKSCCKIKWFFK